MDLSVLPNVKRNIPLIASLIRYTLLMSWLGYDQDDWDLCFNLGCETRVQAECHGFFHVRLSSLVITLLKIGHGATSVCFG